MVFLTINGKGKRFLDEGITTPKFLLKYQESTIIEHIIQNLSLGFSRDTVFYIGLNKDYERYISFIEKIFVKHDLDHKIIVLDDTAGQADTARVLIEKVSSDSAAMWIVNCDTLVRNDWKFDYAPSNIVVEVFESNLPVYSYIDNLDRVSVIAEKKVISRFASTGNYFFQNCQEFLRLFYNTKYDGEIFISDVIQRGIEENMRVTGDKIPSSSVTVLGTPAQYEKYK